MEARPPPPARAVPRTVALRVLTCGRLRPRRPHLLHQLQHRQGHRHPHGRLPAEAVRPDYQERSAKKPSWRASRPPCATTSTGSPGSGDGSAPAEQTQRLDALEQDAPAPGRSRARPHRHPRRRPAERHRRDPRRPRAAAQRPGHPPAGPPGRGQRALAGRRRGHPGHGPAADLHQRGALRRQHPDPPGPGLLAAVQDHGGRATRRSCARRSTTPRRSRTTSCTCRRTVSAGRSTQRRTTLPGYTGTVDLHYAKPVNRPLCGPVAGERLAKRGTPR